MAEPTKTPAPTKEQRREMARALGRIGGAARARKLTKEQRREIARSGGLAPNAGLKKVSKTRRRAIAIAAARARWAKVKAQGPPRTSTK